MHAAFCGSQNAAFAHFLHAARVEHRLFCIKRQGQLADRAVVLLRPRAALLHDHQLIPRCHALLASKGSLPTPPLLPTVGIIWKLTFARAVDLHDALEVGPSLQPSVTVLEVPFPAQPTVLVAVFADDAITT